MVGLYIRAGEEFAILGVKDEVAEEVLKEALEVDVVVTTVAGSELAGAMIAANSKGALICHHVRKKEVDAINRVVDVRVIETNMTCLGNVICVNDFGAVIHPEADEKIEDAVRNFLDVEVIRGTIGGIKTVGMAAVVTNSGGLVHPNASDWEVKRIEKTLRIEVEKGTINFGQDMVGAGIVANTKGYVAGEDTTGYELGIVEQALGFV